MEDVNILIRRGLACLVLLGFILNGNSLVHAGNEQLPAEKEEVDQDLAESAIKLIEEPVPYPVLEQPPSWFVDDQAYSNETGFLDIKTKRNCMDLKQAERDLWRAGVQAIAPILDRWYGSGASQHIKLQPEYVRDQLIHDHLVAFQQVDKEEPIVDGVEKCYIGYARLELDQEFREYTKSRLQEARTRGRIAGAGLVGGTVLSILVVTLGYLKLEAATRGFYSRRLQTLALILALGIIGVAGVLAQSLVN